MTTFYIQTQHGRPCHDFSYELLEALDFHQWKCKPNVQFLAEFVHVLPTGFWEPQERPFTDRIVPIGSIDFVHGFMQWQGYPPPLPINVPDQLLAPEFSGREIRQGGATEGRIGEVYKSHTRLKAPMGILYAGMNLADDQYQFSGALPVIDAEFRCFIYRGELLGIHYYAGTPGVFPDVVAIRRMLAAYTDQPIAFTLDVCVTPAGTFVLEVHHFYACGLYGFRQYDRLPYLFSRWYAAFEDQQRQLILIKKAE